MSILVVAGLAGLASAWMLVNPGSRGSRGGQKVLSSIHSLVVLKVPNKQFVYSI